MLSHIVGVPTVWDRSGRKKPCVAICKGNPGSSSKRYWWRNRSLPQAASFIRRAKCERAVVCGEVPCAQPCKRETFMAVAVMTCWRWVRGSPKERDRRKPIVRTRFRMNPFDTCSPGILLAERQHCFQEAFLGHESHQA